MIETWILSALLGAMLLTAVALVWERWFDPRPATRHALWLLVFVKLALPPILFWPTWTLPARTPFVPSIGTSAAPPSAGSTLALETTPPAARVPLLQAVDLPPGTNSNTTGPAASRPADPRFAWRPWLLGVWLAGSALVAWVQLRRLTRLRRLLRLSRPAPDRLQAEVRELADIVRAPLPRTLVHDGDGSPLVLAWGGPVLLLPAAHLASWDSDRRRAVLAHELAHLARGDHWVGWLELAVAVVWWWCPILPLARRRLQENAELACDARVVRRMPISRRSYAETLLEVGAGLARSTTHRSGRESAVAFGMAPRDVRSFERRLIMVMNGNHPDRPTLRARLGLTLLAAASVPALALAAAAEPEPAHQDRRRVVVPEVPRDAERDDRWTARLVHEERMLEGVTELSVSTNVGAITVVRGGERLRIEATVKAEDEVPDHLKTEVFGDHVRVETVQGRLEIHDLHRQDEDAERSGQPKHEYQGWNVTLRIHLPRPLAVDAKSGVGSITVESARQAVDLAAGVGTLRVDLPREALSSVNASVGAGDVELVLGSVERDLKASAGAGDAHLTLRRGATGNVELSSGAGSVELVVPGSIAGEFELESGVGSVEVDAVFGLEVDRQMTGSSAKGSVGWGGPEFDLHTGVGSVSVKSLEDHDPARPAKRETI